MNSQNTSAPMRSEPAELFEPAMCEQHGEYQARLFVVPHIDVLPIRFGCPQCAAIRQAEHEAKLERQRIEAAAAALRQRIARIGIPKRFADRTLDSYAVRTEAQRRVLHVVRAVATSEREGDSLILCGKPGTGKTHLAIGVARAFAERGLTAEFETVLGAVMRVKDTYRRDSSRTERQAIDELLEPDLLILDEVGVSVGSEHEKMLVFHVINERYQACRSTILISNLNHAELSDYLGDRIMDRFREAGGVLALDWESYRGKMAA